MKTIEDVTSDIERVNYGDKEVDRRYEQLRISCLEKGLPYYEVLRSKTYDSLKYLLREQPSGEISILDMDSGLETRVKIASFEERKHK